MTIFIIKIIACITMVLDHIKYALPGTNNFITLYFGRISFPLFAFLITEGYIHTSNLKKYYIRLIIFGIISQIPFMLFRTLVGEWKMLNIMFTLLLGLISITIYDKEKNKCISIPAVIILIYLGNLLKVDYGWFGVASICVIYIFKNKKIFFPIIFGILTVLFFYTEGVNPFGKEWILYTFFTWLPSILILMYNGKQGKKIKYFFYWFYPVHMLLVYLISLI